MLLDALGRRDEAFQEIERARQEKAYSLLYIGVDAKADPLRADPRFSRFYRKVFRSWAAYPHGA